MFCRCKDKRSIQGNLMHAYMNEHVEDICKNNFFTFADCLEHLGFAWCLWLKVLKLFLLANHLHEDYLDKSKQLVQIFHLISIVRTVFSASVHTRAFYGPPVQGQVHGFCIQLNSLMPNRLIHVAVKLIWVAQSGEEALLLIFWEQLFKDFRFMILPVWAGRRLASATIVCPAATHCIML